MRVNTELAAVGLVERLRARCTEQVSDTLKLMMLEDEVEFLQPYMTPSDYDNMLKELLNEPLIIDFFQEQTTQDEWSYSDWTQPQRDYVRSVM